MTKDERIARVAAILTKHTADWMASRGTPPSWLERRLIEALSVGVAELVLMPEAEREVLIANCVKEEKGGAPS